MSFIFPSLSDSFSSFSTEIFPFFPSLKHLLCLKQDGLYLVVSRWYSERRPCPGMVFISPLKRFFSFLVLHPSDRQGRCPFFSLSQLLHFCFSFQVLRRQMGPSRNCLLTLTIISWSLKWSQGSLQGKYSICVCVCVYVHLMCLPAAPGGNGKVNYCQDERCCGIIAGNIRTAGRVGLKALRLPGGGRQPPAPLLQMD